MISGKTARSRSQTPITYSTAAAVEHVARWQQCLLIDCWRTFSTLLTINKILPHTPTLFPYQLSRSQVSLQVDESFFHYTMWVGVFRIIPVGASGASRSSSVVQSGKNSA